MIQDINQIVTIIVIIIVALWILYILFKRNSHNNEYTPRSEAYEDERDKQQAIIDIRNENLEERRNQREQAKYERLTERENKIKRRNSQKFVDSIYGIDPKGYKRATDMLSFNVSRKSSKKKQKRK